MQGIYVANKRDSLKHVRTVISFNKGGDWQALLLESSTKRCKRAVKECLDLILVFS